jgi:hypothetical protein
VRDQLKLTFGGRSAVTAHRRYHKWLGAELAHLVDDGPHHLVDSVNATTPGRDRDTLPGADAIADAGPAELGGDRGTDVANLRRIQELAYQGPARKRPALEDLESHGILPYEVGKTARRPDG